METREFFPFPAVFDSTPDPVREFIYSALQLRARQQLYTDACCRPGQALSQNVLDTLQVAIDVSAQDLLRIPTTGPAVVVANHPFGLLDDMALDSVLLRVRPDIKILTNAVLCQLRELQERFIPVSVFNAKSSSENFRSVRQVMGWLREGSGVAIFPAGEVSHWNSRQRQITDGPWSDLAVRCARHTRAPIAPVFFTGENSLLFQVAGLLHPGLRTARLPGELLNKRRHKAEVRIGAPIPACDLPRDDGRATAYIRARTYMLGHRRGSRQPTHKPLLRNYSFPPSFPLRSKEPATVATPGIEEEIAQLERKGRSVLENNSYAVYEERGDRMPSSAEGTGATTRTDVPAGRGRHRQCAGRRRMGLYYTHLILWHKASSSIAGSYRLAWTNDVLPKAGVKGLYTSTLFRYSNDFFDRLGPAVELGRSFIRAEHQKDYALLLLLWQAIARCVATTGVSCAVWSSEYQRVVLGSFARTDGAVSAGALLPS